MQGICLDQSLSSASVTSTDLPKGMWNRIDHDHLGERCSEHDEPRIAASTCPAIDTCDASVLMPR